MVGCGGSGGRLRSGYGRTGAPPPSQTPGGAGAGEGAAGAATTPEGCGRARPEQVATTRQGRRAGSGRTDRHRGGPGSVPRGAGYAPTDRVPDGRRPGRADAAAGLAASPRRADAWSQVVSRFYDRAAADPDIAGYFTAVDLARLQRHFLAALMIVTGQGVTVGVVRRMHAAHAGVCTPTGQPITEATWNATIGVLAGVLAELGTPPATLVALATTIAPIRAASSPNRTCRPGERRARPGRLWLAHPRPAHHRPARQRRHQQLPDLRAVLAVFRAGHRDRSPRPGVTGAPRGPPPFRLPPT
jgi:hemoglobin